MKSLLVLIFMTGAIGSVSAQTVGLLQHDAQSLDNGYVLFAPIGSTTTWLIDKCGRQCHSWPSSYLPGQSVYLLPDGMLLRTGNVQNTIFNAGGQGGVIEKIDWTGNVVWSYSVSDETGCQHHDIRPMPNGNILVISWELKNNTEAIAEGRDPSLVPSVLWSEKILELEPIGTNQANVIWEWHLWDHLVQQFDATKDNYGDVAMNPQLVNINFLANANNSDWIHLNAIDYNAELDQILLSSHAFSEIWIIDHSTSTAEASTNVGGNSGRGGDILYRWGNPRAYAQGTNADKKFFGQHNARWIVDGLPNAGDIMVFNNGLNRPEGDYSTVDIIHPPVLGFNYDPQMPYLPEAQTWIYNEGNPNDYYAQNISGAQPLSNGNVLMCNGPSGTFTEVTNSGEKIWEYVNPDAGFAIIQQDANPMQNMVFRCSFYPTNYAGFIGHDLTPGSTIENTNLLSDVCGSTTSVLHNVSEDDFIFYPNPADDILNLQFPSENNEIVVSDLTGNILNTFSNVPRYFTIDIAKWPEGVYILYLKDGFGRTMTQRLMKV